MNRELKSVDTVVQSMLGKTVEQSRDIIQAERDAIVTVVWDIIKPLLPIWTKFLPDELHAVILAIAKPSETTRVRVARRMYENYMVKIIGHTPGRHVPWEKCGKQRQADWLCYADTSISELEKILEEKR